MVTRLLLLRRELRAHRGERSIVPELQGLRPLAFEEEQGGEEGEVSV